MNDIKLLATDGLLPPTLAAGEIHFSLFTFEELDDFSNKGLNLPGLLSSQEETRARRFLNAKHGDHFRLARGALRHLLGQYCDTKGESLTFTYNEYGKPFLDTSTSTKLPNIQFNISHSHNLCAFCFADSVKVGIDVEQYRDLNNLSDLQERICSTDEIRYLRSLDSNSVCKAFYRLWCRKEAFVKAVGRGLGLGLGSIDVLKDSISYPDKSQQTYHWKICDLPSRIECGFACAYESRLK